MYFLLVSSVLLISTSGLKVEIQQPTKNGTFDVGIIITPGAGIKGEAYGPLGNSLPCVQNISKYLIINAILLAGLFSERRLWKRL